MVCTLFKDLEHLQCIIYYVDSLGTEYAFRHITNDQVVNIPNRNEALTNNDIMFKSMPVLIPK